MSKLLFVVSVLLVVGCTSPRERPVTENALGGWWNLVGVGTLATTSDRRVVIVDKKHSTFCAEPPPDVAEAIASLVTSAIEASVNASDGKTAQVGLTASGQLARVLSTQTNQLLGVIFTDLIRK